MRLILKIFKGIHDVEVNSVEAGGEDAVEVAIASTADDLLPFGTPIADFEIAWPFGVFS